jgi:hypothetical protein
MHAETRAQNVGSDTDHKEILSIVNEVYVHVPSTMNEALEVSPSQKIHVIKVCFHVLESHNIEHRTKLQQSTPKNIELQQKIAVTEEALQNGQERLKYFLGLIEYNFTL